MKQETILKLIFVSASTLALVFVLSSSAYASEVTGNLSSSGVNTTNSTSGSIGGTVGNGGSQVGGTLGNNPVSGTVGGGTNSGGGGGGSVLGTQVSPTIQIPIVPQVLGASIGLPQTGYPPLKQNLFLFFILFCNLVLLFVFYNKFNQVRN